MRLRWWRRLRTIGCSCSWDRCFERPDRSITGLANSSTRSVWQNGQRSSSTVSGRSSSPAVLDALAASAIGTLTFKGAALAHQYYPAPQLRARADTDLLVAADDVAALDQTLGSLGYTRQQETSGQLVSYQSHYDKQDRAGVFHAFDVHWKVSNRQAFADCFSFDELWERRIPIPALGVHAATVSRVDALILALVHRAAHHPGSRDLSVDLRSPPAGRRNDGRRGAAFRGSGRLTRS